MRLLLPLPTPTPEASMSTLFIGVMSGTSLDGVDAVLVDFNHGFQALAHVAMPMPATLREDFLRLNQAGANELHLAALSANALARLYNQAIQDLLVSTDHQASEIAAIGAHGQTVRHQPQLHDGVGYTWQLNNPSLLAEHTGIRVVADFRSRDLAAGGQGAPLVPAFHQSVFGQAHETIAVLNIGGMSNISILQDDQVLGFDCGPGNVLMDLWCQQHLGQRHDHEGQWAATGVASKTLLNHFMQDPYFQAPPPKSTGRDVFHAAWLHAHLQAVPGLSNADVQATLAVLTAQTCAHEVLRHAPTAKRLLVCGGGAYNLHLMSLLSQSMPDLAVDSTAQHGLPPLQVEAAAFAWLARQTLLNLPGNLPAVTGARGPRVLGAIYPF
jgi:anhydro-N-acetylmuramic acid kinase